ncbi:hypothetical protein [Marinimicrobium sp. ABcell2]|uniref:hypothetical protein n=1 Tax=Marinimicrobium sp. ABcell2 TaxID=3069751 RepID=UPI0027AEF7CF|nr:hypothetical protein [Marinimicrobium sp. ABcell2]MDQ2076253.1 hypothetical protein [Marinimicrobium sp. ABcell2]
MDNPSDNQRHQWLTQLSDPKRGVPSWLKWSYTAMVVVIVPIYWRDLGPANLLWFSDIALIVLAFALWLQSRLLASTMAVGVLFLELVWVLDFLTLGNVIGVAAYMFSPDTETHIRFLSGLFHLALPPVMLFMLIRFGYDPRALRLQIVIAVVAIPLSYWFGTPESNINWSYGPGRPQDLVHPWLYLMALMVVMITAIYLPSHWVLKRLFGGKNGGLSKS